MKPDVESSKKIDRVGRTLLKSFLILFAAILAYFVLFPILVWICIRLGVLEMGGNHPFLEAVAVPIEWLIETWPSYAKLLEKLSELIIP